jgi:hypothetical protein
VEKATVITYSERVFIALGIQHAKHMRHIVICDLPGSTIFFHIVSGTARLKKVLNTKMCALIFSTTFSETSLILRRIEQDMIKNV